MLFMHMRTHKEIISVRLRNENDNFKWQDLLLTCEIHRLFCKILNTCNRRYIMIAQAIFCMPRKTWKCFFVDFISGHCIRISIDSIVSLQIVKCTTDMLLNTLGTWRIIVFWSHVYKDDETASNGHALRFSGRVAFFDYPEVRSYIYLVGWI